MKKIQLIFTLSIFSLFANAQLSTVEVFKKSVDQINRLKSVSYVIKTIDRNPFAENDISYGETLASVSFNEKGLIDYKFEQRKNANSKPSLKEIYDNGKLYAIDLIDSTYTVAIPKEPIDCDLKEFSATLTTAIGNNAQKVFRKIDTLFEGKNCYSFLIKNYDTVVNGKHDYSHRHLLVNKKDFLPVYFRVEGEGDATKGGYSIGRIHQYSEKIVTNMKTNAKIVQIPFIADGFSLPNTSMLKQGENAPVLAISDLSGKSTDIEKFNHKVLLVVFGSTGCPANPLANPVLNRLYAKYDQPNFSILNIYTSETGEQVQKYIKTNDLKFPIYLGSRKLHNDFKVLGTPNFYIIGSDGKVKLAVDGYSDQLETHLTKSISEELSKL